MSMPGLPAALVVLLLALVAGGCGGTSEAEPSAATSAASATPSDARQVAVAPPTDTTAATASEGARTGEAARRTRVPILMYHVIASAPAGETYPELWVPPARFAAQMRALADAGYEAVTLEQLTAGWNEGAPLPERPIVVTFDDGYLSQSTNAGPVLKRLGWPGVLYLTARNLGASIPEGSVRKLLRSGWELGAHTATHPDLRTLDAAGLQREIDDVRIELRARFGQDVLAFCYPAGKYDASVIAAVKAAGYTTATTVDPGWAGPGSPPFELPRVRVDPTDTPAGLVNKIAAQRG